MWGCIIFYFFLDILDVYNVYVTEGKLEIKRAYISE